MRKTPERIQFLSDVLITAVEGGINYWTQVSGYDPDNGDPELRGVTVWPDLDDFEDGQLQTNVPGGGIRVTLETLAKGIGILDRDTEHYHHGYWMQFWLANRTNGDDGDYDAGIADCILQAGVFGEVVYG